MVIYKKIKNDKNQKDKKRNILKTKRAFKKTLKAFSIILKDFLTVFIEVCKTKFLEKRESSFSFVVLNAFKRN